MQVHWSWVGPFPPNSPRWLGDSDLGTPPGWLAESFGVWKLWIQGLYVWGLLAVPGWCPTCRHRKAGPGAWKGQRNLLSPCSAFLALTAAALAVVSCIHWESVVLGQTQDLQLHPGVLLRSCSSQEGCQGSLSLVPALAELMNPHWATLLCTLPGLSLHKGLKVRASRVWQTQVSWDGNS